MRAPTLVEKQNAAEAPTLDEEQAARAGVYGLLAGVLMAAPGEEVLARLRGIEVPEGRAQGGGADMSRAWAVLKLAAEHASPETADDEYHALFLGIGRGELVPYGSWYLTGFLMERPLADLRDHLAALGFERREDVKEPEDHAGILCEVMAYLIQEGAPLQVQQQFFERHMAPWLETFFRDLEQAPSAVFYRAVGCLGSSFVKLEKQYLAMDV